MCICPMKMLQQYNMETEHQGLSNLNHPCNQASGDLIVQSMYHQDCAFDQSVLLVQVKHLQGAGD